VAGDDGELAGELVGTGPHGDLILLHGGAGGGCGPGEFEMGVDGVRRAASCHFFWG